MLFNVTDKKSPIHMYLGFFIAETIVKILIFRYTEGGILFCESVHYNICRGYRRQVEVNPTKINIYYGGRGLVEDPTIYVLNKMTEVLKELRVEVNRYNIFENKNAIATLPATLKEADGVILAASVEWFGIGGYMQQFLDMCWLYADKQVMQDLYMLPVVMATTYGERDAELSLVRAWETLGGIPVNGLVAYIDNLDEFESNEGYTQIIEKMLEGADVRLNTDFLSNKESFSAMAHKIVYTGMIDAYYDYSLGELEYRSLRFEDEILDTDNYQGNAVVNYTEYEVPYTRIIEHKHFEYGTQLKTVITREYPQVWHHGDEPYYPMNDEKNNTLYKKYRELADKEENVIFGGRLGMYQYFDMHNIVAEALKCAKQYL